MSPRWIVWRPSSSTTNAVLAPALRALRVVAVGPHAGQQDVLDLVLAGPVERERRLEARRQHRLAVARARPLLRQRRVVGVAVRRDVGGDAAPRRPDDRLDRRPRRPRRPPRSRTHVCPYQVISMPRFCTPHLPRDHRGDRSAERPGIEKTGGACPIGAPGRREGGWNLEGSESNHRPAPVQRRDTERLRNAISDRGRPAGRGSRRSLARCRADDLDPHRAARAGSPSSRAPAASRRAASRRPAPPPAPPPRRRPVDAGPEPRRPARALGRADDLGRRPRLVRPTRPLRRPRPTPRGAGQPGHQRPERRDLLGDREPGRRRSAA